MTILNVHIKKLLFKIYFRFIIFITSPYLLYFILEPIFWIKGFRNNKFLLSDPKSILIVKIDNIGDFVLLSATLRELRKNVPNAWITIVIGPDTENIAEKCPYVDEVLPYEYEDKSMFYNIKRIFSAFVFSKNNLWSRKFDLAIIPRWDIDYHNASHISYFSGSKMRVGYSENVTDRKKKSNKNYDKFLTNPIYSSSSAHEVQKNLDIIKNLNFKVEYDGLELWDDSEDICFAKRIIDNIENPYKSNSIALGVGGLEEKRIWSADKFIDLCNYLLDNHEVKLILLGSEKDKQIASIITKSIRNYIIDLTGKTTLREVFSVLKRCSLFIGNDNGLIHIASAAGIPVIEISCHPLDGNADHDNSPKRFGPWGVNHSIVQPHNSIYPCENECKQFTSHCINLITVDELKKEISSFI